MGNFMEILGVLLAGAGLFLFGWLLLGRLVSPAGAASPVFAVLSAAGDGETLEHDVRALLWLRDSDLARITMVSVDCGLNEMGRAAAQLLARREAGVMLCPADRLEELVHPMAGA